jgi:predicted PurR-regulated permease PerM
MVIAYASESVTASRGWFLLGVVLTTASLYFARDVLIPFALAALLSFLLAPLVVRLQRLHLGRVPAVWCVVILAFTLLGALGWLVTGQLSSLGSEFPKYKSNIEAKIKSMHTPVAGALDQASDTVKELSQVFSIQKRPVPKVEVAQPPPNALQFLYDAAGPLLRPLGAAVLVIVLVVFMLLKREDLRDRLIRLMGTNQLNVTTQVLDDAASRISRYLVMQSIISAVLGIAVTIGLSLIGLPNAVLWGLLAAILKFIPYLGPWIAAALPAAQAMAVFDDWKHMLLTILLFILLELISSNLVEPWLYGTRTGVTPLALIVAAIFWTWLWGAVGLILSTPLTVCLVVMGKYIPQLEFLSVLLGDEPVLKTETRLYQRLLAMDLEEASDIVAEECNAKPFVEVCDSLFIPVLSEIERDQHRGMLDEHKQQAIFQALQELLDDLCARDDNNAAAITSPGDSTIAAVLCLSAQDEAGHITAMMFARLLELNGIQAESVSIKAANEIGALVEQLKITLVCFCALPPFAITHTCHLSRHLRNQFPSLDIIVGLWNGQSDLPKARERLLSAGARGVVRTFAEGLQEVQGLNQRLHLDGLHAVS